METKRKETSNSAQWPNDGPMLPSPPVGIDGIPFGHGYEYPAGQLVASRCSAVNNPNPFWIAQIIDENMNKVGKAVNLTVQLYEPHSACDAYSGRYQTLKICDKGPEKPPTDMVDVCYVLMKFERLTRKLKVPAKVIRDLQNMAK